MENDDEDFSIGDLLEYREAISEGSLSEEDADYFFLDEIKRHFGYGTSFKTCDEICYPLSDCRKPKPIYLSDEQIKTIFEGKTPEFETEREYYISRIPEKHIITLNDILTLLHNEEKAENKEEFHKNFCLAYDKYHRDFHFEKYSTIDSEYHGLKQGSALLSKLFLDINLAFIDDDREAIRHCSETAVSYQVLPAMERIEDLPEEGLRYYCERWYDDDMHNLNRHEMTRKEGSLLAFALDKLCYKNDHRAMYIKAMYCYGGREYVYPCDWAESERLLVALMKSGNISDEITNPLGYIAYYGRTSRTNTPDYALSYYFFTLAAADGNPEAILKLSDHFRHGLGVPIDLNKSMHLIFQVLDDAEAKFRNGDMITKYPDALLRYADLTANRRKAYTSLLIASYAIKKRLEASNMLYGDQEVADRIHKALEELKEDEKITPEENKGEYHVSSLSSLLHFGLQSETAHVSLLRSEKNPNVYDMFVSKALMPYSGKSEDILTVVPEIEYVSMKKELHFRVTLHGDENITLNDSPIGDAYDGFFQFYGEHYFHNYKEFLALPDDIVLCDLSTGDEKNCFASVVFHEGSDRCYDYINGIEDLKPGDIVYVPTKYGMKEAIVKDVYVKAEHELILPLSYYKHIIRKVTDESKE